MTSRDDKKSQPGSHFKLNNWLVKPEIDQLIDGKNVVKIESKAMDTLVYLCAHAARPVSNEELLEKVWCDTVVSPATIRRIIKNLRKDLGDDANDPVFIKTIPKRGYQLVCDVTCDNQPAKLKLTYSFSFALVILATVSFFAWRSVSSYQPSLLLPQQMTNLAGREITPSLSPDGSYMIFAHRSQGERQYRLMWRSFDQLTSFPVAGVEHAINPVISPNGKKIAFLRTDSESCQISIGSIRRENKTIEKINSIDTCNRNRVSFIQWKNDSTLFFENKASTHAAASISEFNLTDSTASKVEFDQAELNNIISIASTSEQNEFLYINKKGVQYELWRQKSGLKAYLIHTFNGRVRGLKYCGKNNNAILIKSDAIWQLDREDQLKKLEIQTKDELAYFSCSFNSDKIVFSSRHMNTNIMLAPNEVNSPESKVKESVAEESKVRYLNRTVDNSLWPMFANTSKKIAFLSDQSGEWQVLQYLNGEVSTLYDNGVLSMKPYPVLWSPDDKNILLMHAQGHSVFYFADKRLQPITDSEDNAITMTYDSSGSGIYYISANNRALYFADLKTSEHHLIAELNANDIAVHPTDKVVYFTKNDVQGLWRYNLSDATQELIIPDLQNYSIFQAFSDGIYFNRRVDQPAGVYFFQFDTEIISEALPKIDGEYGYQFSVSHDQSQIVFTVYDNYQSDIFLIPMI